MLAYHTMTPSYGKQETNKKKNQIFLETQISVTWGRYYVINQNRPTQSFDSGKNIYFSLSEAWQGKFLVQAPVPPPHNTNRVFPPF